MYIIDKREDYYDAMAYAYGIDKKIIFNRNIDEVFFNLSKEHPRLKTLIEPIQSLVTGYGVNKVVTDRFTLLVFCGKIYPVHHNVVENTYSFEWPVKFSRWWNFRYDKLKTEILNSELIKNLESKINSPYFLISNFTDTSYERETYHRENWFLKVPLLKDIQFYNVFDANVCYQEIEMYLAMKNKEIHADVPNDIRIQQHGFDLKKSFRN